jgi:hypothetical protein
MALTLLPLWESSRVRNSTKPRSTRKNRAKRPINPCKNQPLLAKLLGSIDPSTWNRPAGTPVVEFVFVLKRDRVMV